MPELRDNDRDRPRRAAAGAVSRLRRFPENRFIGRRDEMVVYDCDDPDEYERLAGAVSQSDLDLENQLQTFAPDSVDEARNRGFTRPPQLSVQT